MQAEVLAYLRTRPLAGVPYGAIVDRHVEAEYAFVRNGQVVGFVDAIEIVTVNLTAVAHLFEIKPKIDTVFGIVRQAKAAEALAASCIPAQSHVCHVVVPHTDPLLPALRAEWQHTWAWGIEFPEGEIP